MSLEQVTYGTVCSPYSALGFARSGGSRLSSDNLPIASNVFTMGVSGITIRPEPRPPQTGSCSAALLFDAGRPGGGKGSEKMKTFGMQRTLPSLLLRSLDTGRAPCRNRLLQIRSFYFLELSIVYLCRKGHTLRSTSRRLPSMQM
jgi:hypothetical protein